MQNSALRVSMEMIGCCCFVKSINSTFLKKRARHYFALCVLLVIINDIISYSENFDGESVGQCLPSVINNKYRITLTNRSWISFYIS